MAAEWRDVSPRGAAGAPRRVPLQSVTLRFLGDLPTDSDGRTVPATVHGSFNDWGAGVALSRDVNGDWAAEVGRHAVGSVLRFCFRCCEEWTVDPLQEVVDTASGSDSVEPNDVLNVHRVEPLVAVTFACPRDGDDLYLAGSFTMWRPIPLRAGGRRTLHLPPGMSFVIVLQAEPEILTGCASRRSTLVQVRRRRLVDRRRKSTNHAGRPWQPEQRDESVSLLSRFLQSRQSLLPEQCRSRPLHPAGKSALRALPIPLVLTQERQGVREVLLRESLEDEDVGDSRAVLLRALRDAFRAIERRVGPADTHSVHHELLKERLIHADTPDDPGLLLTHLLNLFVDVSRRTIATKARGGAGWSGGSPPSAVARVERQINVGGAWVSQASHEQAPYFTVWARPPAGDAITSGDEHSSSGVLSVVDLWETTWAPAKVEVEAGVRLNGRRVVRADPPPAVMLVHISCETGILDWLRSSSFSFDSVSGDCGSFWCALARCSPLDMVDRHARCRWVIRWSSTTSTASSRAWETQLADTTLLCAVTWAPRLMNRIGGSWTMKKLSHCPWSRARRWATRHCSVASCRCCSISRCLARCERRGPGGAFLDVYVREKQHVVRLPIGGAEALHCGRRVAVGAFLGMKIGSAGRMVRGHIAMLSLR